MILDRFKKGFEICTPKSVDEIINDIQYRTQRQKENKLTLVYEPVRYKRLRINNNQIIIERQPGLFNPFAGFGSIIFDLESTNDGTKIKCSIDLILPIIRTRQFVLTITLILFWMCHQFTRKNIS